MKADPWWPWLIAGAGVVALVELGRRIFSSSSSTSSSTSTSSFSDAELGTVADVPGLRDLEAKEPGFVREFLAVMKRTGAPTDKIAALISEETDFKPQYGLMGWIDGDGDYAKLATGLRQAELRALSGREQLRYVEKTIRFAPGYLKDPPIQGWGGFGLGQPDSFVLATKGDPKTGKAYEQNAPAYDALHKGTITTGDVRAKVYRQLDAAKGRRVGPDGQLVSSSGAIS